LQITDGAVRQALVPLTGGQSKVADAGAFFVVCGDVRRHRLICDDAGVSYDARLEAFLVAAVDASLFAQNLVVAFEAQGYGVCYVGGLRNDLDAVDELLDLPLGVYPLYGLCVGVPAEEPLERPRLPLDAVWSKDQVPSDDALRAHLTAYDADYAAYMERRSGKARGWTGSMARKYVSPARDHIAAYYRRKGAVLD
ncbi:MAG: nitroreductase family protein, partial [Deltaproteobacteria bacterium]|nr:nitroreductase family protein [Deltaproteobacteria bacterium]